jgi:hypothetical protein
MIPVTNFIDFRSLVSERRYLEAKEQDPHYGFAVNISVLKVLSLVA